MSDDAKRSARAWAVALTALFCAATASAVSCSSTGTSLAVEVQAHPGDEVMSLTLTIDVAGEATRTVTAPEAGGPPPLPGKLVLRLPDAAVDIKVAALGALRDGTPVTASGIVKSAAFQQTRITLVLGIPSTGAGLLADNGAPCGVPQDCMSGNCTSGVCCDQLCEGACATCLAAEGAKADGTCSPRPAATVCRPSAGACDVAESCDGEALDCPGDGFQAASFVCRAKNGTCDIAEACTGASADCPADVSSCDNNNYCNGTSCVLKKTIGAACMGPNECSSGFCTDGFCCNSACNAGPCDACSVAAGAATNGTCKLLGATVTCRAAAGVCDQAEVCNGTVGTCPADALKPAATVCRAAVGNCDVAESCTGMSPNCPNDQLIAGGTVCRAAVNGCDVAESCTGTSGTCPGDARRGLVPAECPAASQVACNQAVNDSCGNYCGYVGTNSCGPPPTTCGGYGGAGCARPSANVIAGPVGGQSQASCRSFCGSHGASCCEWFNNGDCYAENGNCTEECGHAGWYSADCS